MAMRNFISALLIASVAVSACTQEDPFPWNRSNTEAEAEFSHDMIVLGEQLKDPYSVENMTKALASVYPAAAGRTSLNPTDYYVRFLPSDDSEMQLLIAKGVVLLDHPLDYRIVREGDWYHDPSVPENSITWQYAVVPVEFDFPQNVRYEVLEKCYLTDHDASTKSSAGIDWEAVEREAFRLSGNEDLLAPITRAGESYCPEGRITIMDPDFSPEPVGVKGVRVCCNSFVKIAMGYTDENGYYKFGKSYSTDLRYRLMFKNKKGFSQGINFVVVPASVSTLGTHPASGCSVTIDTSSDYNLFSRCVVNNAGYDYYTASEESGGDIPLPPKDLRIWDLPLLTGSFNVMMHHGVLLETFAPLAAVMAEFAIIAKIIQPDVYLGLDFCNTYNEAYARALRVFAQAGHFGKVGKEWWHEYIVNAAGDLFMKTFAFLLGAIGTDNAGTGSHVEVVHLYSNYCQTVLYRRHYTGSTELFGDSPYSPQLLLYLDERGLGLEKIAPLFTADVTSKDVLKRKMLSYYPQFKTVIMEAFARYEDQEDE